jgi:phosphoglucomutase
MIFSDGSRIIFRLSGTGSAGATIRIYFDSYVNDKELLHKEAKVLISVVVLFMSIIKYIIFFRTFSSH